MSKLKYTTVYYAKENETMHLPKRFNMRRSTKFHQRQHTRRFVKVLFAVVAILAFLMASLAVASAQEPRDPYAYTDPDLQEAQYWRNLELQARGVVTEGIGDLERTNIELEDGIKAAEKDVGVAKEFTARFRDLEDTAFGFTDLLNPQSLLLLLMTGGVVGGGAVAKKQHGKRKVAENGLKVAEAGLAKAKTYLPSKPGTPGGNGGFGAPAGSGEYSIPEAVVAPANRNG